MKHTIALILAAGKGTRMKSALPKVLHRVGGLPMVEQVRRTVKAVGTLRQLVVVGFGGEKVEEYLGDTAETVVQKEQLGTGHAVLQAEELLKGEEGTLLVTCGDTPLVTEDTFASLIKAHETKNAAATILTAHMPDPTGYGRIIRDAQGNVVKIVEQKDGTPEELAVDEVNAGIYCFSMPLIWDMLHNVTNDNAQGEYYLTDIIGMLVRDGKTVSAFAAPDYQETLGVNSRQQLCEAEEVLRQRKLNQLMTDGVTIVDRHNTYVDSQVVVGRDTILLPGTILEGDTVIGENCQVGPYVRMTNVKMGDDDHLQFTYAHDCEIKMAVKSDHSSTSVRTRLLAMASRSAITWKLRIPSSVMARSCLISAILVTAMSAVVSISAVVRLRSTMMVKSSTVRLLQTMPSSAATVISLLLCRLANMPMSEQDARLQRCTGQGPFCRTR